MWSGFPYNLLKWQLDSRLTVLPMGGGEPKQIVKTFARFKPTIAAGLSSSTLGVFRTLEAAGVNCSQVEFVQYVGMPMSDSARAEIESSVGHQVRFVSDYSGTESWGMAYAIDAEHPNHLYVTNNVVIEVVDCETGEPLPDGRRGDFLMTRLQETLMPIWRYRMRDMGRIVSLSEFPASARVFPNARIIELGGRSDDTINLMGVKPSASALMQVIVEAFANVGAVGAQLHRSLDSESREVLEIWVEVPDVSDAEARYDAADAREQFIRGACEAFMSDYPVRTIFSLGVIRAKFVLKGGLETTSVGKVKHVIDRRPNG
ncbi:phenylacetate--CoA ligase family protein [Patescibacteria group bacterium]|nr:phenylacetate--CoA ligase family protein [Patescibacteria group bacterium]